MKVNLFIIGAPKCGTTALSEYLNDHQNIVVSNPKETHFFATDMPKMRSCNNLKEYLSCFNYISNNTSIMCDASVWYLHSEKSIQNIYNYNPKAKIVVMFRDPMEMLPSMHAQHLHTVDEDESSFSKAWSLSENREKGLSIPKFCRCPKNLNYKKIAMYHQQMCRLYKFFDKEQVKVILFDDFKHDTKYVYKAVLHFLDIDYDNRANFPVINQNTISRSYWLKTVIKYPPKFAVVVKKFLKKALRADQLGIVDFLNGLNTKTTKRNVLDLGVQKQIHDAYRKEMDQLSVLISKDLSHWLK